MHQGKDENFEGIGVFCLSCDLLNDADALSSLVQGPSLEVELVFQVQDDQSLC